MKKRFIHILLLFVTAGTACNKNKDVVAPNNNEVNATVLLSNGQTVTISAEGTKAILGLSGYFGSPGFIDGTNDANAAVYINVYPSISSTGTFDYAHGFQCEYRPNVGSTTTPIYTMLGGAPGSITFTSVSSTYLEGSFTARCRTTTDSVIVSGTFKGDFIGH